MPFPSLARRRAARHSVGSGESPRGRGWDAVTETGRSRGPASGHRPQGDLRVPRTDSRPEGPGRSCAVCVADVNWHSAVPLLTSEFWLFYWMVGFCMSFAGCSGTRALISSLAQQFPKEVGCSDGGVCGLVVFLLPVARGAWPRVLRGLPEAPPGTDVYSAPSLHGRLQGCAGHQLRGPRRGFCLSVGRFPSRPPAP